MNDCYRLDDHWALTNRHHPSCDSPTCKGCEECHRHCTCRKACPEHINPSNPRTAPKCIGRTRDNIKAIRKLNLDTLAEAIRQGVNSEAANLAGPALNTAENIEAHGYRQISIAVGRIKGDAEPHSKHPLIVLGWWDMQLRQAYNQPSDKRITVANAAEYLESVLERVAQDPGQEWTELAEEVAACRAHLEAVLHASRGPETGAPCPTCAEADPKTAPRLQKRLAEHPDLTLRVANRVCEPGSQVDENTGRSKCSICRGDDDTWHCPKVAEHWWSNEDYQLRVNGQYLQAAEQLPARELAERLNLPPSTVRSWIAPTRHVTRESGTTLGPPKLKPVGTFNGRKTYSVEEATSLMKTSA
jgi:hypothetical protein